MPRKIASPPPDNPPRLVRWNPYTCPDCRGIFRVPSDYAGRGVVCPLCDRMLRMPRAGETVPEENQPSTATTESTEDQLVAQPIADATPLEERSLVNEPEVLKASPNIAHVSPPPQGHVITRKKSNKHREIQDEEDGWSASQPTTHRSFIPREYRIWFYGASIAVLIAVVAFITNWISGSPHKPTPLSGDGSSPIQAIDNQKPAAEPSDPAAKNIDLQLMDQIVKSFMNAESVAKMKESAWRGNDVEKRIDSYHAAHPWKKPGFTELSHAAATISDDGNVYYAHVVDGSFNKRGIHIRVQQKPYQVDWESWIAWGEMSAEEIRAVKPTKPVEVRVLVQSEIYYNFDFPKESERDWQSYKIIFPSDDVTFHGYVPRAGDLDNALRLTAGEESRYMILRIRYPKESTNDSQVLVDSIVQEGWVKP